MKKLSLVLVLTMIISIFALSGCGAPEPSEYDGKWIAVGAEAFGIMMPIEDIMPGEDFIVEILGVGKAKLTVDGSTSSQSWSAEGDRFVLNIDGEEAVGTVSGDVIAFENMFDTGATMYFAREGSQAANPENYDNMDEIMGQIGGGSSGEIQYVPTEKSTFIGLWECMGYSMSPDDPVEHDPEPLGYDSVADLMRLEFKEDGTVHVNFNDNAAENDYQWTVEEGRPYISSDDPVYDLRYRSDDLLEVFITSGDTYMEIYCQRAAK